MNNLVPDGWSFQSINDVANIFAGGTPSRSNSEYYNGNILWVKSGEVNARQIYNTSEKISALAVKESSARMAPSGSVLLAMYGATAGQVAELMVDATLNQAVSAINSKNNLAHNRYLIYILEFNKEELLNTAQGSGQPNLSGQLIKSFKVPFPPLSEQQKIATILTSVDEVIEKTQAQIDKLKDLKIGMMQELLTNGIGHTEFKDSPVGRIPAEWEVKTLVDCSDKMTNGFVGATRGIYQDDGIPYVLCQNVKPNKFKEVIYKYVNSEFHLKNIRAELKEGDVLTVQTGAGNGDTCVVPKSFVGANCHALIITRLKHNVLNPYFFSEYMNSDAGKNRVNVIATGGAHPHLNTTDLRRELVPVPPIEEQNRIVETLLSIQKKFEILEKKNDTNKNTKKALMQDLLTGKVRVKVDS
jgi:type I restriction enzyme S subunit